MTDPDPVVPDIAAELKAERRMEERHAVRWPILLSWTTAHGPMSAQGETVDISAGGARVGVAHNFALGEKIACRLTVHPWHGNSKIFDIDMSARVVHCNYSRPREGFDVGLQFLGFEGDGKERLAKVVQALQRGVSVAGANVIHGIHGR